MARQLLILLAGLWTAAAPGGALSGGRRLPPRRSENPAVQALGHYEAVVRTTLGDLTVEFHAEDAPNAVRTFLKLAQSGFYDDSPVTCIFKGRMFLAGTRRPTGTGESGEPLAFEETPGPHAAGALAMDRRPDEPEPKGPAGTPRRVNAAGRLMVWMSKQPHLDGDYTVFGHVTRGLDSVAKRIDQARTRPNGGRPAPIEDIVIEQVIVRKTTSEKRGD